MFLVHFVVDIILFTYLLTYLFIKTMTDENYDWNSSICLPGPDFAGGGPGANTEDR